MLFMPLYHRYDSKIKRLANDTPKVPGLVLPVRLYLELLLQTTVIFNSMSLEYVRKKFYKGSFDFFSFNVENRETLLLSEHKNSIVMMRKFDFEIFT